MLPTLSSECSGGLKTIVVPDEPLHIFIFASPQQGMCGWIPGPAARRVSPGTWAPTLRAISAATGLPVVRVAGI